MDEHSINEDYLLLLIEKNGLIETTTIIIDNHFENETLFLKRICEGTNDNVLQITRYINNALKLKLPNKTFHYCKKLDGAYQSVNVNVEIGIQDILKSRELIFTNEKLAKNSNKEFNLEEKFREIKSQIREMVNLWFKVFNIELAYEKAEAIPNMLVYSHRISGWSNPENKITNNLKQQVKTNFGYGSASYFYSLLTFKNIQITPLSEWIDYRYANFSEVIRYTKSFGENVPVLDKSNRLRYSKITIENSYWNNAAEFTKNAANLSITNEQEFIEKYIVSECEKMVVGLETFYKETEFDFIDGNQANVENEKIIKYRVDISGYELIDFRTEKIIGALDFIVKIIEYNTIIPTKGYNQRIVSINKKFIPNVYIALKQQNTELKIAKVGYNIFIRTHNKLIEKEKFYESEMLRLKNAFNTKYNEEHSEFLKCLTKSLEELKQHNHKIKLHTDNTNKLTEYIEKYRQIVKE